jgi:hypothetical protein
MTDQLINVLRAVEGMPSVIKHNDWEQTGVPWLKGNILVVTPVSCMERPLIVDLTKTDGSELSIKILWQFPDKTVETKQAKRQGLDCPSCEWYWVGQHGAFEGEYCPECDAKLEEYNA